MTPLLREEIGLPSLLQCTDTWIPSLLYTGAAREENYYVRKVTVIN